MKYWHELKNPASAIFSTGIGNGLNVFNRVSTVAYWGYRGPRDPLGFCWIDSAIVKNILKIIEGNVENMQTQLNTDKGAYLSKSRIHHVYDWTLHCWKQQAYCRHLTHVWKDKLDSSAYVRLIGSLRFPLLQLYFTKSTTDDLWHLWNRIQRPWVPSCLQIPQANCGKFHVVFLRSLRRNPQCLWYQTLLRRLWWWWNISNSTIRHGCRETDSLLAICLALNIQRIPPSI